MSDLQNRRTFLATAGTSVASVVTHRSIARDDKPKKATPEIRENVAFMDADDPVLASYRKAIEAMKKLPTTNPLSWQFQANMHGIPDGEGDNEGWRWCVHGSWWFLPWHRGYVYFFEKIVRKLSGNDTFRLPYWAWEKEGQNVLPVPFRDAKYKDNVNPLFDRTRTQAANKGQPLRSASQFGSFAVDWEVARSKEQFTTSVAEFSYGGLRTAKTTMPKRPASSENHGGMESFAHDSIHDAVGGNNGNMGDPNTAARDPIFWLHHANVDRLWNRWLNEKGHHLPDPTADADKDWYGQQFPFYGDDGKKVVLTVKEILELAAKESRYDDDPRRFARAPSKKEKPMEPKIVSVGAIAPMFKLTTKPFTKAMELTEDAKPKLMAALAPPSTDAEPSAILLRVEGIKPPKDAALTFEVFLMKKGEKPSKKSYVGPISFFGRRGGHGHGEKDGFTQGFDVTTLVEKLRKANKEKLPELEVSVVPHSTDGLNAEDLAKKKIEVPISNITLKVVEMEKK